MTKDLILSMIGTSTFIRELHWNLVRRQSCNVTLEQVVAFTTGMVREGLLELVDMGFVMKRFVVTKKGREYE